MGRKECTVKQITKLALGGCSLVVIMHILDCRMSPITIKFSTKSGNKYISHSLLNSLFIYLLRQSLPFLAMPYSVDGSLTAQQCLTSNAKLKAFPLEVAKAQQHTAENYFTRLTK